MSDKDFQKAFQDDLMVVKALQKVGIEVHSVYDLVNTSQSYEAAIPVLLKLLPEVKEEVIKEGIVRALTVKEARCLASRPLLNEFKLANLSQVNLKWAIGNALSMVAADDVFEELVELAKDKKHVQAREMLILALTNMKNPRAVDVLIEFLKDEEVAGHAIMALGKLKATKAEKAIEPFLGHQKTWIRKEASKALAKIKKSRGGQK
ncbi:HEAT repeat domain-containing protein [Candidatus Poribacteria bacterium]|nr:HEAT repeat domain-containing protein [Candidatus Poribacteria bacterium]